MKTGCFFTISSNVCQYGIIVVYAFYARHFCIIFVLFHLRAKYKDVWGSEEGGGNTATSATPKKFIDVINCYLLKSCALCFSTWLARRHKKEGILVAHLASHLSSSLVPPPSSHLCIWFDLDLIDRTRHRHLLGHMPVIRFIYERKCKMSFPLVFPWLVRDLFRLVSASNHFV